MVIMKGIARVSKLEGKPV